MKLIEWIKLIIQNENINIYHFSNQISICRTTHISEDLVIGLTKENDKIYDQFGNCIGEPKEFEFLNI